MVDPTVTSSWGSGVEEQNWAFIQNTLQPWVTRIEQAISGFLLIGQTEMRFNLDARLRAKTADRYEAYTKGLTNGFMCADDVRALEDMEPLPDGLGQSFWRPANLIEIGKEPPAPVAPPVAPVAPSDSAPETEDEGSNKSG
jgi:phage portal protein BeeE